MFNPLINLLRRLCRVLAILSVILLISLLLLLYESSRPYELRKSKEPILSEIAILPFEKSASFESYRNTLDGSRVFRPPLYMEVLAAPQTGEKQLQLQGITGNKGNRSALIYDPETDSSELYSEGQYVRDLKVEKVNTDSIVLSRGEERIELKR